MHTLFQTPVVFKTPICQMRFVAISHPHLTAEVRILWDSKDKGILKNLSMWYVERVSSAGLGVRPTISYSEPFSSKPPVHSLEMNLYRNISAKHSFSCVLPIWCFPLKASLCCLQFNLRWPLSNNLQGWMGFDNIKYNLRAWIGHLVLFQGHSLKNHKLLFSHIGFFFHIGL